MADWDGLLNDGRRKIKTTGKSTRDDHRRPFEKDYDRILFSTPVRRLADKTQVFPLEKHDAIRTRLTHSHEVSALARAFGVDVCTRLPAVGLIGRPDVWRDVPSLMAAAGLVHDIGNPPVGHQGEFAIRQWFADNRNIFEGCAEITEAQKQDFLEFDGNPQTLRLVSQLPVFGDQYGLNLTYATLAVLLKYTVRASEVDRRSPLSGAHKPGFFCSEEAIVRQVWKETGLKPHQRHPFAYLIEACDDIAYGVIDVEDTVKKGLASWPDVRNYLEPSESTDEVIKGALSEWDVNRKDIFARLTGRATPREKNDWAMQTFRVAMMSAMVEETLDLFNDHFEEISTGTFEGSLVERSKAGGLRVALRSILDAVTFPDRSILELELNGSRVLASLMTIFWKAITARSDRSDLASKRPDKLQAYIYSRISENYRRTFETADKSLPVVYREAQLLTDMIAGMTDSFAISLLDDLLRHEPIKEQIAPGSQK